jgi:hypothetical protein
MTLPAVVVPNTFQSQSGPIPLSQLDANFSALQTAVNYAAYTAKSVSTARASTSALSNDPELIYAISTAGTYQITAFINASYLLTGISNNGGLNLNINYSGSFLSGQTNSPLIIAGGNITPLASYATYVSNSVQSTQTAVGIQLVGLTTTATYYSQFLVTGTLIATGTGTVGLAWAQAVSNATATTIYPGSYLSVIRVL